ncbi:MAG: DUF2029 domain-containing protein [Acidobacteriota bacterium]|nr:DUF2029 domain-containing protein [Acidobacteriota bacterium]
MTLFAASLAGFVLLCFTAELLCRTVLHLHFDPYSFPLGREHFPDFMHLRGRFAYFHSREFFTYDDGSAYLYPAPVALVYKAFYGFGAHAVRAFVGWIALCAGAAWLGMGRLLQRRGVGRAGAYLVPLLVLCCSYPLWTDVRQANMEIVIALFTSLGIAFFLDDQEYPAAVCFGLAASMKIYPAILLALFLARRRIGPMVLGALTAALCTVAGLWAVCPDIRTSWRFIRAGVLRFRTDYILVRRPEIGTDHSLFAWVKLALRPLPDAHLLGHYLTAYLAIAGVTATVLFFVRIVKLPAANQVLLLSIATILLPPVSFEYTLLNMLAPIGMLVLLSVDAHQSGNTLRWEAILFGCSAVILAPLPEFIVRGWTIDGQIKSVALAIMFVCALRGPLALPAADRGTPIKQ